MKFNKKDLNTLKNIIASRRDIRGNNFIDKNISNRRGTKVGNRPGVTRTNQWIKTNSNIALLDTPGVLWPKLDLHDGGLNLAFCGTIKDEILNIEDIAFIKYQEDFYIINKDLYQKYFNLESLYVEKVKELIYRNSKLVLDEYLVTKASAKMIYEYYGSIEDFIEKMAQDKISIENVANMIKHLDLNLQISEEKKIILKTPQDLVDLLLLSSGCLGINSLTNEIFKVKKPNYLIKD